MTFNVVIACYRVAKAELVARTYLRAWERDVRYRWTRFCMWRGSFITGILYMVLGNSKYLYE